MHLDKYTKKTYFVLTNYLKDYNEIINNKKLEKVIEFVTFLICGLTLFNFGLSNTNYSITDVEIFIPIIGSIILFIGGLTFLSNSKQKKIEKLNTQLQNNLKHIYTQPQDYFVLIYELEELHKKYPHAQLQNTISNFKQIVNKHGKIDSEKLLTIVESIKELPKINNNFSYEDFVKEQEIEIGSTNNVNIDNKPFKKHL